MRIGLLAPVGLNAHQHVADIDDIVADLALFKTAEIPAFGRIADEQFADPVIAEEGLVEERGKRTARRRLEHLPYRRHEVEVPGRHDVANTVCVSDWPLFL